MAASADPSGNQNNGCGGGAAAAGNPNNGTAVASEATAATADALKHVPDIGIAADWTAEEQAILEEGLSRFASDPAIVRFSKIAKQLLENKSIRDVALRYRWMSRKESGKRRKDDLSKKKEKRDRVTDPSAKPPAHLAARPSVPAYPLSMLHMETDDDISYKAIGGVTGQLLEHNSQVFNQISMNLANYQTSENINLFCLTRDNIYKILNEKHWAGGCLTGKQVQLGYMERANHTHLSYPNLSPLPTTPKGELAAGTSENYSHSMNDMPEIMKQMPPLPVKVNEELASSILGRTTVPMQQT